MNIIFSQINILIKHFALLGLELKQNKEVKRDFKRAVAGLNPRQKKAVETIEGPVLVRVTGRF